VNVVEEWTSKLHEVKIVDERDIKIANEKANKLIQWVVAEDMTVDQSIVCLLSGIVSIAKNFKLEKNYVDNVYNGVWQSVKVQEK
jgi:hypothetical protein